MYTLNLKRQTYTISSTGHTIFEFAKPIFENGQRAGTVRLGLKFSPVPLFSAERISLLAMIIFFIFAALAIGYYGVTLALRPLRNLNLSMKEGLGEDSTIEQKARATYLAICLDLAGTLSQNAPRRWQDGLSALSGYKNVVQAIYHHAPIPAGDRLRAKAHAAGLARPAQRRKLW